MRFDLHIHSNYSDGVAEPKEIVKIARQKGLDGIAITDHNTIRGSLEAEKYERDDFMVILGAEIMTERGEVIGLFIKHELKQREFVDLVEEIKSQDGIVVMPHPFDIIRGFRRLGNYVDMIDAVEAYNSRCVIPLSNKKALSFAKEHSLPVTAGSDAHYLSEIGNSGIISVNGNVRQAILNKNVELFGNRISVNDQAKTIYAHTRTVLRKLRKGEYWK